MLNIGFVDLTLNPTLGRPCDTVREGYRKFRVGRHVIFYRVIEQRIDVVRVLHQQMDFESHLWKSDPS